MKRLWIAKRKNYSLGERKLFLCRMDFFGFVLLFLFLTPSCKMFDFNFTSLEGMVKDYNTLFAKEEKEEVLVPQDVELDLLKPNYSIKKSEIGSIKVNRGYTRYEWTLRDEQDNAYYVNADVNEPNVVYIDTRNLELGDYTLIATAIQESKTQIIRYTDSAIVTVYE